MSFTTPDGLSFVGYSSIENLWRGAMVAAFVCMFIVQVFRSVLGKGMPFDLVFVLIMLLCIILGACTYTNHGSFPYYSQKVIASVGPWLLVAVFGFSNPKRFLKALFVAFFILAVVNLIAVLYMLPHGSFRPIGDFWLFGQRNAMRNILYPALLFSIIQDKVNGKRISLPTIFLMVTSPIVLLLVKSSTSIALMVVLEAFYIANIMGYRAPNILKPFSIVYLVLEAVLVFLRKLEFLSHFIVNVLQRDLTLSSRTDIWDLAIKKIQESPWVGTGVHSLENSGLYTDRMTQVSHSHNAALDIVYKGGIFALVVGVALVVRCCLPLLLHSKKWTAFVFGLTLGCFFIAGVVGDLWYPQIFLVLYMAAYLDLWADVIENEGSTPQDEETDPC